MYFVQYASIVHVKINKLFFNFQKISSSITKVNGVMEINALKITLTPIDPDTPMEVILSVKGCFKPGEFSCRKASLIDYYALCVKADHLLLNSTTLITVKVNCYQ